MPLLLKTSSLPLTTLSCSLILFEAVAWSCDRDSVGGEDGQCLSCLISTLYARFFFVDMAGDPGIDPEQQNNGVNTMQHQINSNIAICIDSGIAKTWIHYIWWVVINAPGVSWAILVRAWGLLVRGDFSPEGVYLRLCPSSPSWLFLQSKAFDNADFVGLFFYKAKRSIMLISLCLIWLALRLSQPAKLGYLA